MWAEGRRACGRPESEKSLWAVFLDSGRQNCVDAAFFALLYKHGCRAGHNGAGLWGDDLFGKEGEKLRADLQKRQLRVLFCLCIHRAIEEMFSYLQKVSLNGAMKVWAVI
jgi:hypothetical protein